MTTPEIAAKDAELLRVLDDGFREATRRSGSHLVCRAGCSSCCRGEFAITKLDAMRLQQGLAALPEADADRAARVRTRAEAYDAEREDEPCPVLDPETDTCDLYAYRPVTCRVFGPASVLDAGGIGTCELCYVGASDEEIAACAVRFDPDGLEAALVAEMGESELTVAGAILGACGTDLDGG